MSMKLKPMPPVGIGGQVDKKPKKVKPPKFKTQQQKHSAGSYQDAVNDAAGQRGESNNSAFDDLGYVPWLGFGGH